MPVFTAEPSFFVKHSFMKRNSDHGLSKHGAAEDFACAARPQHNQATRLNDRFSTQERRTGLSLVPGLARRAGA
jgi:hypothetical protein